MGALPEEEDTNAASEFSPVYKAFCHHTFSWPIVVSYKAPAPDPYLISSTNREISRSHVSRFISVAPKSGAYLYGALGPTTWPMGGGSAC